MTHRGALLLLVGGCQVDQGLNEKEVTHPVDTTDGPTPTDDTAPPPMEECNGVDDNGDGVVDEGFPDADLDGVADCVEERCVDIAVAVSATSASTAECTAWSGDPVADPWNVTLRTSVTLEDEATGSPVYSYHVPIVLPTQATGQDSVAMVVWDLAREYGVARWVRVSADGGTTTLVERIESEATPSVADVDGDGEPELIFRTPELRLVATAMDGTMLWDVDGGEESDWGWPVVADLEGDGRLEIVETNRVYDAATGAFRFEVEGWWVQGYVQALVADLDLDGLAEIVLGEVVSNSAGTPLWSVDMPEFDFAHTLVVQADEDAEGELAFVSSEFEVRDTDGAEMWRITIDDSDYPFGRPGPPCAGDLDGDGLMEVVVPQAYGLVAIDLLDRSVLWEAAPSGWDYPGGCSTSDLNGDGIAEVLFADEERFGIYDGPTGTPLFLGEANRSVTHFPYPVTADLDADGHAEIVLAGGHWQDGGPLLEIYSHAGEGWTPGGSTWLLHDYNMANIDDEGVVPITPEPSWTRYGVWRGRLASADSHPLGRNLQVDLVDVCVAQCGLGTVLLSLQATNAGTLDVPEGTAFSIYAVDADGERLVLTQTLPALPATTTAEGFLVELPITDLGQRGMRVAIDDDGTGLGTTSECVEDDNGDEWMASPCG